MNFLRWELMIFSNDLIDFVFAFSKGSIIERTIKVHFGKIL